MVGRVLCGFDARLKRLTVSRRGNMLQRVIGRIISYPTSYYERNSKGKLTRKSSKSRLHSLPAGSVVIFMCVHFSFWVQKESNYHSISHHFITSLCIPCSMSHQFFRDSGRQENLRKGQGGCQQHLHATFLAYRPQPVVMYATY